MKIAAVRRWKAKERKFNRQYRLKTIKKSSTSRDFSGKFVFLLSKTNLCAVVKFISKNVCVTETLLAIDENILSQISPKYVIPHSRHKKLLHKSEVKITKQFRLCCEKFFRKSNPVIKNVEEVSQDDNTTDTSQKTEQVVPQQEQLRKITPIKIMSCNFCNQKFLKRELLDEHVTKCHFFNNDESSESDSELHIDDDVELLLDEDNHVFSDPTSNENRFKEEVKAPKQSGREFKCLQCSALCGTEESLLTHIERSHPCSSTSTPKNLIGYNVDIKINNHRSNQSLDGKRSLSSASSFSSISNHSATKSPEADHKIKYQRYDSSLKYEFSCRMCSTTFKERSFLNRHLTNMHLSRVYKCYKCNVPFNKKLQLTKHLHTAHLKYKDEQGFLASISNLETVGYFQCCFCKYSSKLRNKVAEHMTNEHYEDFEKGDGREDSISSSPDSLEELLLPETKALRDNDDLYEEDLLQEMEPKGNNSFKKAKKPANDPSFRYRCARCQRRFSRSSWLKKHPCPGVGMKIKSEPEQQAKKPRLSYLVNGFLRCNDKSCSKVFTDRNLYDYHVKTAH
ncbi:zinc finger protein 26-like [Chironomus tepperi]|uniref:zinc finger protein 26-like n=1 Tax=Chironomus tepperi TaxID=113505 RepID=UPI00391F93A6